MADLVQRLLAGERDAVAEALNLVDDRRPGRQQQALRLLDTLACGAAARAHRVGLTGAPGAGKSTLLAGLIRCLRERGESVGVVAVDPSSRRSGGALLGDRLRLRSGTQDAGVYIRSLAARERLGGLADATRASLVVLATVFDRVFVETVGVGQSESEVASLVDTLVYVAQPGAGDTLQFMKAGLLEHPDVFVVNKADLGPVAQRTASELEAALGLALQEGADWTPRVLLVSARDAQGLAPLVESLDAHRLQLERSGALAQRRARGAVHHVLDALARRYGSYGVERVGGPEAIRARVLAAGATSPFRLVLSIGHEIEEALRKPRA